MELPIANNNIVTINELNNVLQQYQDNKTHEAINIVFQNPIAKFDIVFIAGLILLWYKYETKFSIEYKNPLPDSRIFEVRQYLQQYQRMFNKNWRDVFDKFKNINELGENDYHASESFSPIIFVSRDTIDMFFNKTKEIQSDSEVFTLCKKYINEKITYHNKREKKYLNSQKSIKNKLLKHPTIYSFVFTVLYNKVSPFVDSAGKGIKNPSKRTEQLWEFTKEYVKGLHELAKNIVEHSNTGEGMITIRAYENSESTDKVLETYVFDFGTKGIVPKLIDDTTKNSELSEIYKDDLSILNGVFEMEDFIVPSVKTKLNQQLYRDIAHYGLARFYKLIRRNEGFVTSSSTGKNGERDFFKSEKNQSDKSLLIGTSYYFQLPFKHDLFKSTEYDSSPVGLQGSPQTLNSISEILKIKVIKDVEEATCGGSGEYKYLIDKNPSFTINDRNGEAELFGLFAEIKDKKNIHYIAIDFSKIQINDSSLLRFLAHLSTNYSQSIIFYNLDFEVYDDMIENNKQFFQTLKGLEDGIPFWYENKGILIYTRLKDPDFNFADILYGRNEQEFQSVNHTLNHTFPNTLSITQQIESPANGFEIPASLKCFFYQSALLPFDLLFYTDSNKLLFQSNLENLLMQEINADEFDEIQHNE